MALVYFVDGKVQSGKQYMGKNAVRRIVDTKDETIADLTEKAKHRWVRIHQLHSKIEKLERKNKIYLGVIIGHDVLLAIIGCCAYYSW